MARQPILDVNGEIKAYELLFRNNDSPDEAWFDSHSTATATVLVNTLSHLNVDEVLGKHIGFVNVTRELLLDKSIEIIPPHRFVLEILENVVIDDEIVLRCKALKKDGYKFALDDFIYEPIYEAILPLVDYIKIDLTLVPLERMPSVIAKLKRFQNAKLLAEKVETKHEYEVCKALGFHLFQGYFFTKAEVLKGRKPKRQELALMKMIALIQMDADIWEIESLFKQNPDLVVGLLRLVNSVGLGGRGQKVSSLRHAMMLIGHSQLLNWLQLLLYSTSSDVFNKGLLQMVITRARLMELLAQHVELSRPSFCEQAFMVGMLSLADALLKIPLDEVFKQIGLTENLVNAVLHHQGTLGQLLQLVKFVEVADFEQANPLIHMLYLSANEFNGIQLKAIQWANELQK
jgi:EAL and modified HD-GYP domain-containing signal transduction protein